MKKALLVLTGASLRLPYILALALLLLLPSKAYAGCDDIYRNALINHLRDRSQYSTYSALEQSLTSAVQDSVTRNSGFSLSAIVEGTPIGAAFSSQGARDLHTLLTDRTSVVVTNTLLQDVTVATGNASMAQAYNQCRLIEQRGLSLELVSFNPDAGQVTMNLIKTGGAPMNILSVGYDRSQTMCNSTFVPRNRPIPITGVPSYTCRRIRSGTTSLPITIVTDAGALSFSCRATK